MNILLEKQIRIYLKKWNKMSKKQQLSLYFVVYTLVFTVCSLWIFSSYIIEDKSFMWTQDAMPQHYAALRYTGPYIRDIFIDWFSSGVLQIPMYDFNIGMGESVFKALGWNGLEYFNLLSVFFKVKDYELLYNFLVLLRDYLVGASFSIYCFFMKKNHIPTMLGAVIYTFTGFALYAGAKHPFFLNAMIFLPILLIGLEKILKKEKPFVFIIMVGITFANGYYFAYMSTVAMGIYALIRFFAIYKVDRLKEFGKLCSRGIIAYLIGLMISAMIFIPGIMDYLSSARTEMIISTPSIWSYDGDWLKKLIIYFITPAKSPGVWLCFQFPPLVLIMLTLLYSKCKQFIEYKVGFVILALICMVPLGGLMMTGFGNVNNRWSYIMAFLVALICVEMMEHLFKLSAREQRNITLVSIIYSGATILLAKSNISFTNYAYVCVGVVFLLMTLIIVILNNKGDAEQKIHIQKRSEAILLAFVIINIGIYGNMFYSSEFNNYVNEYAYNGEITQKYKEYEGNMLANIKDESFYRTDKQYVHQDFTNDALLLKYNGVSDFFSIRNNLVAKYMRNMENSGTQSLIINRNLGSRTIMETLASVKYYLAEKNPIIPYGFTLYEEIKPSEKGHAVYINEHFLPIGYTYDNYILEEDYKDLNPIQKQETMLQQIVLDAKPNNIEISNEEAKYLSTKIPYKIESMNNVEYEDGVLKVLKDNGSMDISFEGLDNAETYIRAKEISVDKNIVLSVKAENIKNYAFIRHDEFIYKTGASSYTINMGYNENAIEKASLIFAKKGTYKLEEIEVYCQPMDDYVNHVNSLKEEPLEDIVLGTNTVTGTVDLSKNKLLCLSIPYNTGWTAKVDGESRELIPANTMYMALPLTEGYHEIELNYCIPGLKLGALLSVIGLAILLLMIFKSRKSNNENRR